MTDARLETIRALLAQAESTNFVEEAEAFNAKAAELMARYAIDEAMLARAEHRADRPSERRVVLHRPYTAQKALLVCQVAEAFQCSALRLGPTGAGGHETVGVVGFESDLNLVETLVTSLLIQLNTAMLQTQPLHRSGGESASWRRSFISGFVAEVVDRLTVQRNSVIAEGESRSTAAGGESVAVVLADRSDQVVDEFRRRYPRVRMSRVSIGSSAAGLHSGRSAGARADLGGRRVGSQRALSA